MLVVVVVVVVDVVVEAVNTQSVNAQSNTPIKRHWLLVQSQLDALVAHGPLSALVLEPVTQVCVAPHQPHGVTNVQDPHVAYPAHGDGVVVVAR